MKIVTIPGDINALVDELRVIRDRAKKDRKREDEITTTLKDLVEQQPASLHFRKSVVALIEEKTSERIDSERLKAAYPDVAKDCLKKSSYLQIKLC